MTRLIDSDSLLRKIHDTAEGLADCDQQNAAWALRKYAVRDIMDAPSVDAVEVVRCRDCKWYMPGDLFTDIMFCHRLKKYNGKPAKYYYCADDFCSYGERKDGDE